MNHDWFYPAPSMVSSSGDENDVYAAQHPCLPLV